MTNKLLAEFIGTAFLLIGVVGSGIMAETLSPDNIGVALMGNAVATGCILYVLITILGPISGAHFNPAVTLAFMIKGALSPAQAAPYIAAQIAGGIIGVWLTHFMFDQAILQLSQTARTGSHQWVSEIIATFGLLFVIFGGIRHRPDAVPALVGLYITGAYWFTASTSFANPAVTIARSLSDTFAGISPAHMPIFIVMQLLGAFLALVVAGKLFSEQEPT